MKRLFAVGILCGLSLAACGAAEDGSDVPLGADYEASIEAWRADRVARLKAADGYLNQIGLFWLKQGSTSFGGSADNDIVFPADDAARIGSFELGDDGVTLQVNEGVDVLHDGKRVRSLLMLDDTTDAPVSVSFNSLAWNVINREGKYAVRLRDYEHPLLEAFPAIPHFDVQPEWRVEATLRRFDQPKVMNVGTVIEGLGYNPSSPGIVEFAVMGTRFELEAYESGDRLFFVFGDKTSGRQTYPAGRFLYAEMPGEDGKTWLDFNQAYNPPCAFNDFSTCPVASPQNRLDVAVSAGEKFDASIYHGATLH